jgi:hypothetical protein
LPEVSTRPYASRSVALSVAAPRCAFFAFGDRVCRVVSGGGGGILRDLRESVDLRVEFETLLLGVAAVRSEGVAAGAWTFGVEAVVAESSFGAVWV